MVRGKGPSFGLQLHKNKFIVYATYLSIILFFSIENISCAASTMYVARVTQLYLKDMVEISEDREMYIKNLFVSKVLGSQDMSEFIHVARFG